MGLRGAHTLFGGDFKVIIWGSSRKVLGPVFMGAVDPWKHHLAIGERQVCMKW